MTDPITYWREGAEIIENCLQRAIEADPANVPFPLTGDLAKVWHMAQAVAYQHALEMMGPPEGVK